MINLPLSSKSKLSAKMQPAVKCLRFLATLMRNYRRLISWSNSRYRTKALQTLLKMTRRLKRLAMRRRGLLFLHVEKLSRNKSSKSRRLLTRLSLSRLKRKRSRRSQRTTFENFSRERAQMVVARRDSATVKRSRNSSYSMSTSLTSSLSVWQVF